jgi:hypothetical protein
LSYSSSPPLTAIKFTRAGTMAGRGQRRSREQAKSGRSADLEQGGGCGARADPSRRSAAAAQAGESGGGVPSGCCAGRGGQHRRSSGARATGAGRAAGPEQTRAAGPEQWRAERRLCGQGGRWGWSSGARATRAEEGGGAGTGEGAARVGAVALG